MGLAPIEGLFLFRGVYWCILWLRLHRPVRHVRRSTLGERCGTTVAAIYTNLRHETGWFYI